MKSSSCLFRVLGSSKPESSFFKTPAVSFILVTSAITARVPNFKQRKSQPTLCSYTSEMCPPGSQRAFQWEKSVFSGLRCLWLLRRGKIVSWLIHQASWIQSSLKSLTVTQMSAFLWFYAECFYVCCLYVVLRVFHFSFFVSFFFFEPCLLFYRLVSTFLGNCLRRTFSCGSYLTRAAITGVYCHACSMQDWSLNTEPSKC